MTSSLLEKTRRITRLLQTNAPQSIVFSDICAVLGEVLASNAYVISKKGKVLGIYSMKNKKICNIIDKTNVGEYLDENQNDEILYLRETKSNIKVENFPSFNVPQEYSSKMSITIIPISIEGERLGTLLLDNGEKEFDEYDLVLAEYGAMVVGMEMLRAMNEESEIEIRKKTVIQLAIASLSYSEIEAVTNIIKELEGDEGLLVASKVADKVGITRSVIVNALRKLESAGVIESRSLGMKGTFIRIINDKLIEELEKVVHHK